MSFTQVKKLNGPILILGAGGFIGFYLLQYLMGIRRDIFGALRDPHTNWRVKNSKISKSNLLQVNLLNDKDIETTINKVKPRTIFNLAAYGAYARQNKISTIYETNFSSTIKLIETLKLQGFDAYVHAGSQSEYGLNSTKPKEGSELIPNSHYAVSKTADYYAIKYYGKIEKLPVSHLRLYSAYGPWEEPDRLIPILLSTVRKGDYPNFVDSDISRDFIYVQDIVDAFIITALRMKPSIYGEVFNIATGKKTTIKELALLVKKIFKLSKEPIFGGMEKRRWDMSEWYGNSEKAKSILRWISKTSLEEGIKLTTKWQEDIDYDKVHKSWRKITNH